jgi:hypothetical protein
MTSGQRIYCRHLDRVGRTKDFPRRGAQHAGLFPGHPPDIALGGDWKVKLAVFEHFGPDAAVNALAEMFNELAVDVFGNGFGGFGRVNLDRGGSDFGFRLVLPCPSPAPSRRTGN